MSNLSKTGGNDIQTFAGLLFSDISVLIRESRTSVAIAVNAGMTMLYWQIGKRISEEILKKERAAYGQEIVSSLARQLAEEYGRGFSEKSLRHMIRFFDSFPNEKIVSSLLRQLSWTHFIAIIYLDDPLKREFYAEMCRVERWSTRTLQKKIGSMLYERTALSGKPESLIEHELAELRTADRLSPDLLLKDPYILDFLDLKIATWKRIWKMPYCVNWKIFCLSWGPDSPSWLDRNGCRLTTTISISTCCFTTAS